MEKTFNKLAEKYGNGLDNLQRLAKENPNDKELIEFKEQITSKK